MPILKNGDDADDVINELFLKSHNTAHGSLPSKNRKAWLRTVARNLARNKLKRDSHCSPIDWVDDIADPSSFEETVLNKIDFEISLSCLRGTKRRIVAEKIGNQRTHREIALLLGLPEGTVRRQYCEALEQLRQFSKRFN